MKECLGAGDGIGAAQAVLKFSANQNCAGKEEQEAFCREMEQVFLERCRGYYTVSHVRYDCAVLLLV